MLQFATRAQYADYMGLGEAQVSDDVDRLLRHATTLLKAKIRVGYDTDDDDTLTALENACCAQVEWWLETGDEKEATARFASPTIAGTSVKTTGTRMAPRARDELALVGLDYAGVG